MDLKLLREATRPEHEATEAAVPLMQPGLTREDYVAVLLRFHRVVCAWDTFAAAEAPAAFQELVRQRRRCASLEADLRELGQEPIDTLAKPELVKQIRAVTGGDAGGLYPESRFLGAMYVLEGSTLGGQYIALHVESVLGLSPGHGDRFFRGYEERTMPMWREFQQVLRAVPEEQGGAVIEAAKGMFGIFQDWMTKDEPVE